MVEQSTNSETPQYVVPVKLNGKVIILTEDDFEKARVSGKLVKLVAEQRLRIEAEQLGQNPVAIIKKALESAAETPDDIKIAAAMYWKLNEVLKDLKSIDEDERKKQPDGDGVMNVNIIYKIQSEYPNLITQITSKIHIDEEKPEVYVRLPVLVNPYSDGEELDLPRDYVERVLRILGALKESRSLDSFRELPLRPKNTWYLRRTAYYNPNERTEVEYADQIPTVIPGVKLRVYFSPIRLFAELNPPAFQRAIAD